MKKKTDFQIIIRSDENYDITQFVSTYKFQGGPEQPIRYFEMEVPKKAIDTAYPNLISDEHITVGKTKIYVDAVGHGTFIITKLWLKDYCYEFIALGLEQTLNTASISSTTAQFNPENPARMVEKIFNDWVASYLGDESDIFDIWFSKSFALYDSQTQTYDHSQASTSIRYTRPNTSSGGINVNPVPLTIKFKEGMPSMVALSLCALIDDAFIFVANGTKMIDNEEVTVNRLYYVRYGDDPPLASNPNMPAQDGVINIYPDITSQYQTYTQFDYLMAVKMAGLSSKDAEGSETITNVQRVSCVLFDESDNTSATESNAYSIERYGNYTSPTIASDMVCTDTPNTLAYNIVKRYKDPSDSITFTMTEARTVTENDSKVVGWEETIPVYSYAKAINDSVNEIYITNEHKCEPTEIGGNANPDRTDNALLRLSTYIRAYPEMVTEYTFGVMKDTTIAQEITSSLSSNLEYASSGGGGGSTTSSVIISYRSINTISDYWLMETFRKDAMTVQRATRVTNPADVYMRTSTDSEVTWSDWVYSYASWKA